MNRTGKFSVLVLALLGMGTAVSAQSNQSFKLNTYGFFDVRSYFDTRTSVGGADNYLYLYPLNIAEQIGTGIDANDRKSASMFGATTRFGFNLTGPQVLGAASRANVEFDIFNYSSTSFFLFRHCYVNLDWESSSLIMGQTWHPMGKLIPGTGSIALGSPFNALNRSGQLRYDFKADGGLVLSAAAVFQSMSNSFGPKGKSYDYQRASMLPEMYAGLEWNGKKASFATGALWQKISPAVTASTGKNQYVESIAGMAQATFKSGKFQAMAKTYLGENMSQLGFCTGYGKVAGSTDEWASLLASVSWLYADYGADFKLGCFAGYMKNLGADKEIDIAQTYISGGNIDRMFRLAPNVKYKSGNTTFTLEYDLTGVSYGNLKSDGMVSGGDWVDNHRILLAATYSFSL